MSLVSGGSDVRRRMFSARVTVMWIIVAFLGGLGAATFGGFRVFLPVLLKGAVVTVQIAIPAAAVAILCALCAGLARSHRFWLLRWAAIVYVEIFRGVSLVVLLFWFYFVLPEFGLTLTSWTAAISAMGLNFGAYGAEVVRGALTAIPRGQYEAATALNMTRFHRLRRIVLPQALVIMIPPFGNLAIELTKATSLVSALTLTDITFAAVQLNQLYYRTGEIFLVSLLLYFCFSQILRILTGVVEARFDVRRRAAAR